MSLADFDLNPRCAWCNKLLAVYLTRPWVIDCHRCKTRNDSRKRSVNS